MAQILQRGNKVTTVGEMRKSRPRTEEEAQAMMPMRKQKTGMLGGSNRANDPSRREAGMKKGGEVRGYGAARKPMKKGGMCR